MPEAFIVEAVRTPIGKRNGSLAEVHPVDLSAHVLRALVDRTGIDPSVVDDVVWGCVNQVGDQGSQVGRYAVLAAGWPESVPGVTINRACGSSQSSFDFAAGMVMSGQYDVVVAGGVESMTRVPLGSGRDLGRPFGLRARERYAEDLQSGEFPNGDFNQGIGAERIAATWGFSRQTLDEYATRSHELTAAAIDAGAFDAQLVPVPEAPGLTPTRGCAAARRPRRWRSSRRPSSPTGSSTPGTRRRSPTARRRSFSCPPSVRPSWASPRSPATTPVRWPAPTR